MDQHSLVAAWGRLLEQRLPAVTAMTGADAASTMEIEAGLRAIMAAVAIA